MDNTTYGRKGDMVVLVLANEWNRIEFDMKSDFVKYVGKKRHMVKKKTFLWTKGGNCFLFLFLITRR